MADTLVIVESPGKTGKIAQYLGPGFTVRASVGHIRDLPSDKMSISSDGRFSPQYALTPRGKQVANALIAEARRARRVILATDPDREGEAISWHIAEVLGLTNPERITFQEITKTAVTAALAKPRRIDMHLVRAQEARRSLDRLIGYTASRTLSSVIGINSLTGGRVQSPATRIVVDREREIAAFVPTAYFGVRLKFDTPRPATWSASWDTKPYRAADSRYMTDEALTRRVMALLDVTVEQSDDTSERKGPPSPFTTSTMQQVASRKLRTSVDNIMKHAQALYEAGLITYHRTDSPNLSPEGYQDIVRALHAAGHQAVTKQRTWTAKGNAQEAHEAVRPTHSDVSTPPGLSSEQQALYTMIRERAMASQMPDAIYAVRTIVLKADSQVDGRHPTYIARGRNVTDPGWTRLTAPEEEPDTKKNKTDPDDHQSLPDLKPGTRLRAAGSELQSEKTKPPPRYTEATLIKAMEKHGIGRPATYAQIMKNIQQRGYIAVERSGTLLPTDIAYRLIDEAKSAYSFLDLQYTADLERQLDEIAEGRKTYVDVVSDAYKILSNEDQHLTNRTYGTKTCPKCGSAMLHRNGKSGFFWGCSTYPSCTGTAPSSYTTTVPTGTAQKSGSKPGAVRKPRRAAASGTEKSRTGMPAPAKTTKAQAQAPAPPPAAAPPSSSLMARLGMAPRPTTAPARQTDTNRPPSPTHPGSSLLSRMRKQ